MRGLAKSEEGRACFVRGGACGALVEALKAAEDDRTRGNVALTISELAKSEEGRACFVRGGACRALVEALKAAEADNTRSNVAAAMRGLAKSEEGRACFVALDAVRELKLVLSKHHMPNGKDIIISVLEIFECFCSNKRMKLGDGTCGL
jgi:hypothetical protein